MSQATEQSYNNGDNQPTLSVIIPFYDEEESLPRLHEVLMPVLEGWGRSYEVVFVDDGSRDRSPDIARRFAESDPHVRLVRLRRNCGKTTALAAGFRRARGEFIITMDADLQDDPAQVPRLVEKLEEDYDVVGGWRKHRQDSPAKLFSSRIFNLTVRSLSQVELHDFNCGLKGYRREVWENLDFRPGMHRYLPVQAKEAGFKVTEVEVPHRRRYAGQSKFPSLRFLDPLLDLLTVLAAKRWSKRPLHSFAVIGLRLCVLGLGLHLAHWVTGSRKQKASPVNGALTLSAIGLQIVSIGLLGEMLRQPVRPEHLAHLIEEEIAP